MGGVYRLCIREYTGPNRGVYRLYIREYTGLI